MNERLPGGEGRYVWVRSLDRRPDPRAKEGQRALDNAFVSAFRHLSSVGTRSGARGTLDGEFVFTNTYTSDVVENEVGTLQLVGTHTSTVGLERSALVSAGLPSIKPHETTISMESGTTFAVSPIVSEAFSGGDLVASLPVDEIRLMAVLSPEKTSLAEETTVEAFTLRRDGRGVVSLWRLGHRISDVDEQLSCAADISVHFPFFKL